MPDQPDEQHHTPTAGMRLPAPGNEHPRRLLTIGVLAWARTLRLGHLSLSGLQARWQG